MADPLSIPALDDIRVRNIGFCGYLLPDAPNRINPPMQNRDIIATVNGPLYVRLIMGGIGKPLSHVHIDVARPQSFKGAPRVNGTLESITEIMSSIYGETIQLRPFVHLMFPREDFPSNGFLAQAAVRKKVAEYDVQQTTAKYMFNGVGALSSLEWKTARENDREVVPVDCVFTLQGKVERDYLTKCYPVIKKIWRRWVYGEEQEDSR